MVTAPFSFDCAKALNDCQIELIDMQCDLTLKETFLNVDPKDFCGGLSEDIERFGEENDGPFWIHIYM